MSNFLEQEECDAILLFCQDHRFRKDLQGYVEEKIGLSFDACAGGGAAKDIIYDGVRKEGIFADFRIAKDLHKARKIVITHHLNCGAYKKEIKGLTRDEEIEFQKGELRKAKEIINSHPEFLGMEIILLFVNEKDGKPEYLIIQ